VFWPRWLQDEKLFWRVTQPALVFLAALAVTLLLRRLLLSRLRSRARSSSYAAVFLDTIRLPSLLWCLAAAVELSLRFVELSTRQSRWASDAIVAFLIVSFSLAAASIAVRTIAAYGERQGMPFAVAGLTRTLTRVLVLATGLMTLLAYLNISITPMLTALGIGGLAVALALQDTLANFFAGLHILVERPIFVGDFIRLESGQEGVVTDIGWRTTRVRTLSSNMVVAPNTKITSGTLVNYSLPDPGGDMAELPILLAPRGGSGSGDPAGATGGLGGRRRLACFHAPGAVRSGPAADPSSVQARASPGGSNAAGTRALGGSPPAAAPLPPGGRAFAQPGAGQILPGCASGLRRRPAAAPARSAWGSDPDPLSAQASSRARARSSAARVCSTSCGPWTAET
jgi:small-conductance mechanosensitive channel